jgi:ribose transport system permease protein
MNRDTPNSPVLMRFLRRHASVLAAYGLVVALFATGALSLPGFAGSMSILSLLVLASFTGIAAIGQNMVILLGGIDMSIPYMITLGSLFSADLIAHGVSLWGALLAAYGVSVLVGVVNGLLSALLNLHPLIITLGVGYIVNGALNVVTQGVPQGQSPAFFNQLSALNGRFLGLHLPPVIVIWAVLAAIACFVLYKTRWGRDIYAVGANARAARLMRISKVRIWIYTYIASAVLATTTGLLLAGFSGAGYFQIGDPYLFITVGAVAIGGTSLLGGSGGYVGTIAGTLVLTEITTILTGFNVGPSLQEVLYGAIVILMISVYGREAHVRLRL